ncbi:MAG: hypothetical protein QW757_03555, partial [Candidatus Woesearchaeota archaeon]
IDEFNKKIIGATELVNENLFEFDKRLDEKLIEFNEIKVDKTSFDNSISSINNQITELTAILDNTRKELLSLFEIFNNKVDLINEDLGAKIQKEIDLMDEKIGANVLTLSDKINASEDNLKKEIEKISIETDSKIQNLENNVKSKIDDACGYFNGIINSLNSKIDSFEKLNESRYFDLEKKFKESFSEFRQKIEESLRASNENYSNRIDEMKRYLNDKIVEFHTELDRLDDEYKGLVTLNKMFNTIINGFDSRLDEFNEKFNSKIVDLKQDLEDKIKLSDELIRKRVDDLTGFIDKKTFNLEERLNSIQEDTLTEKGSFETRISDIELKIKSVIEENRVIHSNLNTILGYYTKIKDDLNRKMDFVLDDVKKDLERIDEIIERKIQERIKTERGNIENKISNIETALNDVSKKLSEAANYSFSLNNKFEDKINYILKENNDFRNKISEDIKNISDKISFFDPEKMNYFYEEFFKIKNKVDSINHLSEKIHNLENVSSKNIELIDSLNGKISNLWIKCS